MSASAQPEKSELNAPSVPTEVKPGVREANRPSKPLQYWANQLRTLPPGDPRLTACLTTVSGIFLQKFRGTQDIADLNAAKRYQLAALSSAPEGHPGSGALNQGLCSIYDHFFRINDDLSDLEAAHKYALTSVASTALGGPRQVLRLMESGTICMRVYVRTGHQRILDSEIRFYLAAISATPQQKLIEVLYHLYTPLGIAYQLKYEETGELEYLNDAIRHLSMSLRMTSPGHPRLPMVLAELGLCYNNRYCRLGQSQDFQAAFQFGQASFASVLEGYPELSVTYQALGSIWKTWFTKHDSLANLEYMCKYTQAAVARAPKGQATLLALQTTTSTLYMVKYKRTGDIEDLEIAFRNCLAAVTETPEGHPSLKDRHEYLGMCYKEKYTKFGDMDDLEAAIQYLLKAVARFPKAHHETPMIQWGLGYCYTQRYHRLWELDDLEAAIQHSIEAANGTPVWSPDLPMVALTLGMAYIERYKRLGKLLDLDNTTELFLEYGHDGHPATAAICAGLGTAFLERFITIGLMEDLVAAIEFSTDAINIARRAPSRHPSLPLWQSTLALGYSLRYDETAKDDDKNNSYKFFTAALQSQTASPQQIWEIATTFIEQSMVFSPKQLLYGYHIALKNLPSLLWQGSTLRKRHDILIQYDVSQFISKAVLTALEASEVQIAVEFMEQGLSTTHKQSLQLRDEHSQLQARLPALSQQLHELSMQLLGSSHTLDNTDNYHVLTQERQQLVSKIRKQPGFSQFLQAPEYIRLCLAAKNGPVILLNYSDSADAIIMLSPSASPIHLPLPGVSLAGLETCAKNLNSVVKEFSIHSQELRYARAHVFGRVSSGQTLESVTSWIWENIVKPVFDIFHKHGIKDGRIWWCPSGPFTHLPLHAAAPLESSLIQSYTPTLETLIHAYKIYGVKSTGKAPDTLTAVGVVKTSTGLGNYAELPFVGDELDIVTGIFGEQAKQLKDSQATIDSVVKVIESSPWLHLACHGQQDLKDPLKSSLILYDGVLELGQIMDLNLSNAKFVYLSACETAVGDPKLINEAMHLAGGFLAAGFQGAVGTLWSMTDHHGPMVAKIVYQSILGEDNIPDVKMAAKGLHLAVQRLRKEGAPLHQWMPFIHLGV